MTVERPVCRCHGLPMVESPGDHPRCPVKRAETVKRAKHKYVRTAKGQATYARYENTRIRVRAADVSTSYRVSTSRKTELQQRLADFRTRQRTADGRIDQAVS